MKVSELLEATGDDKFDRMLGGIKDKAQRSVAFSTKVRDAVQSIPDAFKLQHELEDWMSKELTKIRLMPNKALQRFRAELQPLIKEYRDDTGVLEMLYFHASDKDPHGYKQRPDGDHEENLQDVADAFMHRHLDDVQDAVTSQMSAYEKLKKEADQKEWPTGKQSYMNNSVSKFSSEYSHARSIAAKLQHWFK
jgi:hypothetical protein